MRWITDEKEFKRIKMDALSSVFIDSGRHETKLQRLQFDDSFFGSENWCSLLKKMMEWSNLEKIHFTVLDPDPEFYFHDRFNLYPCFELEKTDFPENFIAAYNKPYSNQPGEKLIFTRMEFTVTSHAMPWFIHTLQTNTNKGGHLWVPKDWPERIFKFNRDFIEA